MSVSQFKNQFKKKLTHFYEEHEIQVDIAFFVAGFLFDALMVGEINEPFAIFQQVAYLLILAIVLFYEICIEENVVQLSGRLKTPWHYRQPLVHFFMGTLLNIYSLFFLKSASFFSSSIFLLLLAGLLIANELPRVRSAGVQIKVGFFVVLIFCFYSMVVPTLMGSVGPLPYAIAVVLTAAVVEFQQRLLIRRGVNRQRLLSRWLVPSVLVIVLFVVFYVLGWIPPVPISAEYMGVFHKIEKKEDQYLLYHEKPWWKFWRHGDEDFTAEPGDQIYFFVSVYSPARFSDTLQLVWSYYEERRGWKKTDSVPMKIVGGRKTGYRGFAAKGNYAPGSWRVSVQTTDEREIGRLYFTVEKVETANLVRSFSVIKR
ncbi:MAG: DUF2914 domain-containing protein [Bdellovibrio sp.]|nr:MAG: DUF2914 domain-containing protein [Bdellovibrio sp.]